MDVSALSLVGIMVVPAAACVALFVGSLKAMRRAGAESRRRWIARAAVVTWLALAILTPAVMLAALDVLPHWVFGAALAAAVVVGMLSSRLARRGTMRTQSFA